MSLDVLVQISGDNHVDDCVSPSKMQKSQFVCLPFSEFNVQNNFSEDMQVLKSMWFSKISGSAHQDILESFYSPQVAKKAPSYAVPEFRPAG